MTFSVLDLFFFVLIILCIIAGIVKGFIDSVFDKAAPLVAVFASFMLCHKMEAHLLSYIKNSVVALVVSFLVIFVFSFIIVKIIQVIIGKLFDNEILNGLNRTLGFAFGLVESLALICIILWALKAFPFYDLEPFLQKSLFFTLYQSLLIPATSAAGGPNV